jgi:hypothetical protein
MKEYKSTICPRVYINQKAETYTDVVHNKIFLNDMYYTKCIIHYIYYTNTNAVSLHTFSFEFY